MHLKCNKFLLTTYLLTYRYKGFRVDMLLKRKCRYVGYIPINDETYSCYYDVHAQSTSTVYYYQYEQTTGGKQKPVPHPMKLTGQ